VHTGRRTSKPAVPRSVSTLFRSDKELLLFLFLLLLFLFLRAKNKGAPREQKNMDSSANDKKEDQPDT
jgi:hypothetical protein